jgi:hypothetical protein
MKTSKCISIMSIACLFVAATAIAHHNSGAVFDLETEVTIAGVIEKYEWRNPHLYFYVATSDNAGASITWRVEAGPLALMKRLGWTRDSLVEGDKIEISANPSRNPERHSAFLVSVKSARSMLPSFRRAESFAILTGQDQPDVESTDNIFGTWVTLINPESEFWVDDPSVLPLIEKGVAALEAFDEATMHPGLTCTPFTAPAIMVVPDTKSIEDNGDTIRIRADFDNVDRVVHLTGKDEQSGRVLQGQSFGRWEDNVLVVETAGFADHDSGNGFGLSSGPKKHLLERFSLNPDGKSLNYWFEFEDSDYLSESYSGEVQWAYRPGLEYTSEECDLENSRLFLED